MGKRGFSLCLSLMLATAPGASFAAEPAAATPPPDAGATTEATLPAPGEPTSEQCIDANESAQKLLRTGSLAQAREKLTVCLAASCPEPIRNDCKELSKAIEQAVPTIQFDARDKAGAPVTNVRVTMDGKPLAERLDGTPLPVEPGKHQFLFESPGLPRTTKALAVNAGEHRNERVEMVDLTGPVLRTAGLVVAGIGVIAIGYGSYRGIQSKSTYDDALKHCPNGPNSCSAAGVSGGEDAHDQAAAATTAIIVGAVLAAGGAALYFLVPEEGFRITPGVRAGGLSLEAATTW
jgi:hypothetical protein